MSPSRQNYKSGTVKICVDYGYDLHDIVMSKHTYDRICSGKQVSMRGQGFCTCEGCEPDFWSFNTSEPGSLYIRTDEGRDVYIGNMDDGNFWVEVEAPQ